MKSYLEKHPGEAPNPCTPVESKENSSQGPTETKTSIVALAILALWVGGSYALGLASLQVLKTFPSYQGLTLSPLRVFLLGGSVALVSVSLVGLIFAGTILYRMR